MLGEVPTSVTSPPSSEPNAIGIRKRDGEASERRANWKATGIMIASAPMFLMKAESTVTAVTSSDHLRRAAVERAGRARWISASTTPERATAALTRSALATMMTMSSLKPAKASSGGTMPTSDRGEQREERDEVVAEAAPDEERHHAGEIGEGERSGRGS